MYKTGKQDKYIKKMISLALKKWLHFFVGENITKNIYVVWSLSKSKRKEVFWDLNSDI